MKGMTVKGTRLGKFENKNVGFVFNCGCGIPFCIAGPMCGDDGKENGFDKLFEELKVAAEQQKKVQAPVGQVIERTGASSSAGPVSRTTVAVVLDHEIESHA